METIVWSLLDFLLIIALLALGWTALMEAIVLGDGGPNHVETVRALVEAGADKGIPDKQGTSPLEHSRARGYSEMTAILEASR